MKNDLRFVCDYLKRLIIPQTPAGFKVAEPFRYGLSDEELLKGITAFRTFLYDLYDKIADDAGVFDVEKGKKYDPESGEDSIQKCFPIINEIAVVLSTLGFYGKLETEPNKELIVTGNDLLKPLSATKPPAMNKISNKRKAEIFRLLSETGFYFEDLNYSDNIDLTKTGTFYITYENDNDLITGLKLLAEAKNNIKAGYQKFMTTFMRGDFYSLSNSTPKAHTACAAEFAGSQPPEIREWIINSEKLLNDYGCKISCFFLSNTNGEGTFSYVSPKSKKTVCRIIMNVTGSFIDIRGNHFNNEVTILYDLPESMLDIIKTGKCGGCAENNSGFISCRHGGPFKFTYKDESFERCAFGGYVFSLDDPAERELITKWIEYELQV